MAVEVKDKWIRLVNPDGVEEDAWDFPGHVDRLLTIGWTRPAPSQPVVPNFVTTIKNNKEN